MDDLLPCPFCGGSDISSGEIMGSQDDRNFVQTACINCGASSGEATTDEEADKLWNTRAAMPKARVNEDVVKTGAEWSDKNDQWPNSFDSGNYQGQRNAYMAANIRFIATFKNAIEQQPADQWRDISSCPDNITVFFASYYTPSEEAAKNGAQAYWTFGSGSKIIGSKMLKPLYTGILGGNPSHWTRIIPPLTKTEGQKA